MKICYEKKLIPFVLLFRGRTGSSYLMSSIRSHPEIHACEEELIDHMRNNRLRKINDFMVGEQAQGFKVSGFKTKYSDIGNLDDFSSLLQDLKARVIVLERRNIIKQVVSFITGEILYNQTGDWNVYGKSKSKNEKIKLEWDEFDRELQKNQRGQRKLVQYATNLKLPTL